MREKDEQDFALAIGRLVLQCARLEIELIYHTAGLINATDCEQGYRKLRKGQVSTVLDEFKKLIKSRTSAGHDSLREKLSGIASDAEYVFDRRNALVHSVWVPVERNVFPYDVLKWDGKRHARNHSQLEIAVFERTEVDELHSKAKNLRQELTLAMHYAFTNCSELFQTRP
jgi:hypothetical protein